jgi:hypothetical protein
MDQPAKRQSIEDLRREIARICDGKGTFQDVSKPRDFGAFTPAPPDARLAAPAGPVLPAAQRMPFGRWLLLKDDEGGPLGELVRSARADPGFPESGDAEAVRRRLREVFADGDLFAAVDDAELDWLSW